MPKVTKYPRLRTHVRKGAAGQRWVSYYYDMRPEGKKDIPLGADYELAVAKWNELHNDAPKVVGRMQEAFTRWREVELPKYKNPETRRGYERQLTKIEAWCGQVLWEDMTLPIMHKYLEKRSAKTQGNREMSLMSIVWGKARLWGMTALPWPAAGVKKWKNEEVARKFKVTQELFDAAYEFGDQVLRDALDIVTATGMRLTDVRTVELPPGDLLHLQASKTGKTADFDVSLSQVLPGVIERRRTSKATHPYLLTSAHGRAVSERMLSERWDKARRLAAMKAEDEGKEELAEQIRTMIMRDMRKRASNLAGSLQEASTLLQHESTAITQKHYRDEPEKLKPVR